MTNNDTPAVPSAMAMTELADALDHLDKVATRAPWKRADDLGCKTIKGGKHGVHKQGQYNEIACTNGLADEKQDAANADIMVKVRNHLPTIVTALRELTRLRAQVREGEKVARIVRALKLLEDAELAHANCDECDGEGVPELCPKCFPLFDDARVARRIIVAEMSSPQPQPAHAVTISYCLRCKKPVPTPHRCPQPAPTEGGKG